jgi:hypothetical protein
VFLPTVSSQWISVPDAIVYLLQEDLQWNAQSIDNTAAFSLINAELGATTITANAGYNLAITANGIATTALGASTTNGVKIASINDILPTLISSNVLQSQNYINSNSITDVLTPYISSNIVVNNFLLKSGNINLNQVNGWISTLYGTYYDITNGTLGINATPTQMDFLIVGGQTTIQGEMIVENRIKENNQYLSNVYISSNVLSNILLLYPNYNYSSNFISSNVLTNVLKPYPNYNYLNSYTSNFISSNVLSYQNYINSNSIINILTPYPNYNYLNTYSSNFISSNVLTNVLSPYTNYNYSSNFISSNVFSNVIIPYTSSNALNDITLYNMPNLNKKNAFYCTVNTITYPNNGNTIYYKYDLDLRNYTKTGFIQIGSGSGDTYRIFKIKIFYGSCYFSVISNGLPNILSYEIYMSEKANPASPGVAGLNICAIGFPENYLLKTIMPNNIFLMRNDTNNFNFLSIISTDIADVRVIIEDMLN